MDMSKSHDDDGWEEWTLTLHAEDRQRIERENGLASGTVGSSYTFHGMRGWDDGEPVLGDWYGGAPGLFEILQPIAEAERTRLIMDGWEASARAWAEQHGYDLVKRSA